MCFCLQSTGSVQDRNGQSCAICDLVDVIITRLWSGTSESWPILGHGIDSHRHHLLVPRTSMIDFHFAGRITDKQIGKIIVPSCHFLKLYSSPLFSSTASLCTLYTDHRGPQSRKTKQWSFLSSGIQWPPSVLSICLFLSSRMHWPPSCQSVFLSFSHPLSQSPCVSPSFRSPTLSQSKLGRL